MTTDKILIAALLAGGAFYFMSQKKEEEGVKETAKEIVKDEEAIQAKVISALEGVVEAIDLGGLALANPAWAGWKHQIETGKAKIQIKKIGKSNYSVSLFLQDPSGKLRRSSVAVRAVVKKGKKGQRTVQLIEPSSTFKTKAREGRQRKAPPSYNSQTAVMPATPVTPGTEKQVAQERVNAALAAVRADNNAPLNALLTTHLPSSTATARRPNVMQEAISEAVMMQMMGYGFQLKSGVPMPDAELDYFISLAAVLINHGQAQKLAREALQLGGSGPINLAELAEKQAKEQIEKGQLTAQEVQRQMAQLTTSQRTMLDKVVTKARSKGLLTRVPSVPGYNITFADFVKKFNITPGTPPPPPNWDREDPFSTDLTEEAMNGIYGAYGAISTFAQAATNPSPRNFSQPRQNTTRWGPVGPSGGVPNTGYLDLL